MLSKARELATYWVYAKRFGSKWAKCLSENAIWPLPTAKVDGNGGLSIPSLGASIPATNSIGIEVLKSLGYAIDLHKRAGAEWWLEDDSALVTIGGIKAKVFNSSDINMLHEVFAERLYDFHFPGEYLVLDIGANLGVSALHFAAKYGAEVWAYELVPTTAKIARLNLQLNPTLGHKITLHEFGVADEERQLRIPCDPARRPSNSLFNPPAESSISFEEVTAKPVAPIVKSALAELGGRKLVVKLDAEGAEYGIIRRLAQAKLLDKIDLLLLEWHEIPDEDPEELRQLLAAAGFVWFERSHDVAPVGFVNAMGRSFAS